MSLPLRVVGFVVFVAAVSGATYGAYQYYDLGASFTAVVLTPPAGGTVGVLAGTAAPLILGAENVGDQTMEVRLASKTNGVEFTTEGDLVTLAPASTTTVRGALHLPADARGVLSVRVDAVDNATGRAVGSVKFDVMAHEPLAGELSIKSLAPVAIPGGTVTLEVTILNPAGALQRFTLGLEGAEGTFTPPQLSVPGNSSGTARVVLRVPTDALAAFSPTVVAENEAGIAATAAAAVPVVGAGQAIAVPLYKEFQVRPGGFYSIPVLVVSNLADDAEIEVAGEGVVLSTFAAVQAGTSIGGFITVQAPDSIPSTGTSQAFGLRLGTQVGSLSVKVLPALGAPKADAGTRASVDYIGRLRDGSVFDTSIAEIALAPYPKAPSFAERPSYATFTVNMDPNAPQVITGFFKALLGLPLGATTTAVLPPAEAYGGARMHSNVSAVTELEREGVLERYLRGLQPLELPPEFQIDQREVGDVIPFRTEVNGLPIVLQFRVAAFAEDGTVTLERVYSVGDRTTFYTPWPNATEVVEVRDEEVVLRTTPPPSDEPFAWNANPQSHQTGWGETTTVDILDEERIVLRHEPVVGMEYMVAAQGAPPTLYRVEGLVGDQVQVSRANPSPLAGQTLVFDIYVRDVETTGMVAGSGAGDGHDDEHTG